MALLSAGITDIGQKRKSNQDSIYLGPEKNLFLVADGMGGHNGGDIASQLAVKTIPEYIIGHYQEDAKEILAEGIRQANHAIRSKGQADPKLEGMGTTTVGLLFRNDSVYIGNVGDSRAYLINKGNLYQLTRDHSMIQEKISLGIYTREQGAQDPHKNVLVRTVGFEENVEIDVFTYKVCKNDLFLICSDGLHGKVSERDMTYIINKNLGSIEKSGQAELKNTVKALVDQANKNGGGDNISVIMVWAHA